ncbi:MAG: hypothetical protein R3A10_12055 [Caldilineaceae bacterium]
MTSKTCILLNMHFSAYAGASCAGSYHVADYFALKSNRIKLLAHPERLHLPRRCGVTPNVFAIWKRCWKNAAVYVAAVAPAADADHLIMDEKQGRASSTGWWTAMLRPLGPTSHLGRSGRATSRHGAPQTADLLRLPEMCHGRDRFRQSRIGGLTGVFCRNTCAILHVTLLPWRSNASWPTVRPIS